MGVFYNSICLPGRRGEEVAERLARWLAARGFERREGPVLFDLDDASERSAYLLTGERWTILFYSHYEEDRRLIHELQGLGGPLLYLWVHDSDVWGWDLFDEHGFAGSFSSAPRAFQPFSSEEPGGPGRPWGDPEELCRRLGMPRLGARVAQLQARRAVFQEETCREFARLLGAEAAASSYDDLEREVLEGLDDRRVEHLFFSLPTGPGEAAEVDLHGHRVTRWIPGPHVRPESTQLEISPELLREMARMRRRLRLTMLWLKPMSWLSRTWRRGVEASSRLRWSLSRRVSRRSEAGDGFASYRLEGRRLLNDRHGCLIELPEGVEPAPAPSRPPLVFAFRARRVVVTCTARRLGHLDEVMRRPSRSRVLRDERFHVDALPARHLIFELPPQFIAGTKEPSVLGLYVVQTGVALYVFLYRHGGRPRPAVEKAIRATVESFRWWGAGAPAGGE